MDLRPSIKTAEVVSGQVRHFSLSQRFSFSFFFGSYRAGLGFRLYLSFFCSLPRWWRWCWWCRSRCESQSGALDTERKIAGRHWACVCLQLAGYTLPVSPPPLFPPPPSFSFFKARRGKLSDIAVGLRKLQWRQNGALVAAVCCWHSSSHGMVQTVEDIRSARSCGRLFSPSPVSSFCRLRTIVPSTCLLFESTLQLCPSSLVSALYKNRCMVVSL